MKHSDFVHLHLHTEYSFLDGAIRISDLVKKAVEYKMPALAITDHGGMFGAVEFYQKCISAGIKPVIGCEFYVAPGNRNEKKSGVGRNEHLVLLARNQEGYKNLMRLTSIGYLEGYYYKPRIDMDDLRKHADGLICLSACIGGKIPQLLLQEKYEEAKSLALEFNSLFGQDHFYLEIQKHGIDDELVAFERIIQMSKEINIPLVVTNDAHYLNHSDSKAHEVLLCIQTGKTLHDDKRMKFSSDQIYFKSPQEMSELFPEIPEAFENTVKIAEMCNVKLGTKDNYLPNFPIPEGFKDEKELLLHNAKKGLAKRYKDITPAIEERLNYELDVICSMGFAGYFLIVEDFAKKAKDMGVYMGCRGSAAGSIAAYSLEITDIDPLKYDLIFERFLNPERISMPDVDADFADKDRSKVIDYVVGKYGRENVCQIVNFGRMKSKAVVRDVARVMGLPYSDGDIISKLIPGGSSLKKAMSETKELEELINSRGDLQQLWEYALVLEGLVRQPGMHAAGLIIASDNIVNFAPLYKPSGAEDVMTQYDMNYVEEVGLIKMDFLGLKTLTVLQDAVGFIEKNHGKKLDLWNIDYTDKATFDLYSDGFTVGIFQFESNGMRDYLRKLKPELVEDLIAMNALYRPGPMKNIDSFIHRKHGVEKVIYPHELLKPILDVTYGIIIYQEQVMRIAQVMGGFTLGQADILRKAMGKKKADVMAKMGEKFIEGAQKKGIDKKTAKEVYDLMSEFAQYGFNKAHAAVYAHLSYQSAYLKVHYPAEFMAALLSTYKGNDSDVVNFVNECKRMGIEVLPPDINESNIDFNVVNKKIRFGLGALKNVGEKAIESIIETREKEGKFTDIFSFAKNVDLRTVNKRVLESLVCAGAFDSFKGNRAQHFAAIDSVIGFGQSFQKDRNSGQTSLFDVGDNEEESLNVATPPLPQVEEWPHMELLTKEKEIVNMYVSGHPLERFRDEVNGLSTLEFRKESYSTKKDKSNVIASGIVSTIKTIITKRAGKKMAFLKLEDFYGTIEVVVFSDLYEKHEQDIQADSMIIISGKFEMNGDEPKIIAEKILKLEQAREKLVKSVHINLKTDGLEESLLKDIDNICKKNKGECKVVFHLFSNKGEKYDILAKSLNVNSTPKFIKKLRVITGNEAVSIKR